MSERYLIVFYSWSGCTRRLAQMIAEETHGELYELQPEIPYPQDYDATVRQAKAEIAAGVRPALKPMGIDLSQYGRVYVGSPNWCSTIAPPVASFLYQTMPTEKFILPFCTHGGGGAARMTVDLSAYCMGCDVLPMLAVYDRQVPQCHETVHGWILRTGHLMALGELSPKEELL
ncbi:flavodoxin [Oscillibacter sp. MSJ-2]|uniref:Flavodoxin n=1 Tax=Dysosmobacter acutus TaxID=2841504 RepID=A0ABS6F9V1_9FIRM|nr:flavodoxin [Dysosmobacter acutus]